MSLLQKLNAIDSSVLGDKDKQTLSLFKKHHANEKIAEKLEQFVAKHTKAKAKAKPKAATKKGAYAKAVKEYKAKHGVSHSVALKKVSAEFKKGVAAAKKTATNDFMAMVDKMKKKGTISSKNANRSESELRNDASRTAKGIWRTSKTGKRYREYRANRTDETQGGYPKLAKGGKIIVTDTYQLFNLEFPKGKKSIDGDTTILESKKGLRDYAEMEGMKGNDEFDVLENIEYLRGKGYTISNNKTYEKGGSVGYKYSYSRVFVKRSDAKEFAEEVGLYDYMSAVLSSSKVSVEEFFDKNGNMNVTIVGIGMTEEDAIAEMLKQGGGYVVAVSTKERYEKGGKVERKEFDMLYEMFPDNWEGATDIWKTYSAKKKEDFRSDLGGQDAASEGLVEYWDYFVKAKSEQDMWDNYPDNGDYAKGGKVEYNADVLIEDKKGNVISVVKDISIERAKEIRGIINSGGKAMLDYALPFSKGGNLPKGGSVKKKGRISVVNEGEVFDAKKYPAIMGDFDNDGLLNADDPKPRVKGSGKKQIEQVKFTDTFDKLLTLKEGLDGKMNLTIDELDEIAPKGAKIYARTKTPYSILKKLVDKRLTDKVKGLTDLVGTTIAVDNYKDLVAVNTAIAKGDLGKVVEREDMYKKPKAGYRAIHFLVDVDGTIVEIQLKTKRMKQVNEVSHEFYKNGNLNGAFLKKLTSIVARADKGEKSAIRSFNSIMKNKIKLKASLTK